MESDMGEVVYAPRMPNGDHAGNELVRRAHFWAWFRRVHGDPAVVKPGVNKVLIHDMYEGEFALHEAAATGCGLTVTLARVLVKALGEPFVCVEPGVVLPGVGIEHPDEMSLIGAWAWSEDDHE